MASSPPDPPSRLWLLLALLAMGLGIAARWPGIASEAFWFDEVMTIRHLEGAPADVVLGIVRRVDPPLYYAGMAAWIPIVGSTEFLLRLPSLIAGCAALWMLFAWIRRSFDVRIAAIATLLLALQPQAILYSQEARFYSFMILLGIASTAAWDRLVHEPGSRSAIVRYACAAAALFYMHFIAGLVLAAHATHALVGRWLGWDATSRRQARLGLFAAAALCVPYFLGIAYLYLFRSAGRRDWIQILEGAPGIKDLAESWGYLSGAMGPMLPGAEGWLDVARLVLFGIATCAGLVVVITAKGTLRSRYALQLCVAIIPMLLLALISQRRSVYIDRYLIASLPSVLVLVSAGMDAIGRRRASLPIAVAAAALMFAALWSGWPTLRKSDWPGALREVASTSTAGDLLLVEGPTEREGVPYPGDLHITTCFYYQERLEEGGETLAAAVVPLPFELLARKPSKPKNEREMEELGLAKSIVDSEVIPHAGRVFVAITIDPFDQRAEEEILERAPAYARLRADRGEPQVTRYQRLRLLRFDAR